MTADDAHYLGTALGGRLWWDMGHFESCYDIKWCITCLVMRSAWLTSAWRDGGYCKKELCAFGGRDGSQTSAAKHMRTTLFWVVIQRVGTISETVRNCHYTLRNDPEESSSWVETESNVMVGNIREIIRLDQWSFVVKSFKTKTNLNYI